MQEERRERRVGHILAEHAAEAVPETIDLWPAISARLPSQPRRFAWGSMTPTTRLNWAFRPPTLVGVATALLLAALLSMTGLPWSARQHQSASAAELLNNLAVVAATQPADASAAETGYRYIKYEALNLAVIAQVDGGQPVSALVSSTRQMWIAPDGSGRIRETTGAPTFLGERDRAAWQAAGSRPFGRPINQDFGPGELFAEDFVSLPTDPDALAQVIRERAERADPPVDIEMFIVVGDILRQPGVPRELRAALYKVAANIPGVELVGNVTDRAGRPGIAVAKTTDYWGGEQRFVLIFDPKTSALLGEEKILLERVDWLDATPPVVIGHTTYLESGIVASLPGGPPLSEPTGRKRVSPRGSTSR